MKCGRSAVTYSRFGAPSDTGLDFKRLHDASGLAMVVGMAASAHRADESMVGQRAAIVLGGILSEWWM
jgi:hypothetical protein